MTKGYTFGDWRIPQGTSTFVTQNMVNHAEVNYLPILLEMWRTIEGITGYRWRATSYWRDSPSHRTGCALDIAPDFSPSAYNKYSLSRGSDPVLFKRPQLVALLKEAANELPIYKYDTGIFIENDHLHLQIAPVRDITRRPRNIVAVWRRYKPIYSDTVSRTDGPHIISGVAKKGPTQKISPLN